MGRDAKVGHYAVHGIGLVVFQKTTEILEVGGHEGEALILDKLRLGIGILVEGNETTAVQFLQNGTGVTAATVGDIDISPFWTRNQIIDRKLKKNGVMIFHWPPPFPANSDRGASPR